MKAYEGIDLQKVNFITNHRLEQDTDVNLVGLLTSLGQIGYSTDFLRIKTYDGVSIRSILQDNDVSSNSDFTVDPSLIATRASIKSYVEGKITGFEKIVGAIGAGANPNYPAASQGEGYRITAAGKIGGASGVDVEIGDIAYALVDTAGGDQATVGGEWYILQSNIDQATESVPGWSAIATQGETNAGLDDQKFVTPLKLTTWYASVSPTFVSLSDTPASYAGASNRFVRVNGAASALEFVAGGSINVSEFNNDAGYLTAEADTLSDVLGRGNTTGANNISVTPGQSIVFNNSSFTATISEPTLSGNIALTLPASSGTFALLSDIPAGDGNGIYDGSGAVPTSVVATLTDSFSWQAPDDLNTSKGWAYLNNSAVELMSISNDGDVRFGTGTTGRVGINGDPYSGSLARLKVLAGSGSSAVNAIFASSLTGATTIEASAVNGFAGVFRHVGGSGTFNEVMVMRRDTGTVVGRYGAVSLRASTAGDNTHNQEMAQIVWKGDTGDLSGSQNGILGFRTHVAGTAVFRWFMDSSSLILTGVDSVGTLGYQYRNSSSTPLFNIYNDGTFEIGDGASAFDSTSVTIGKGSSTVADRQTVAGEDASAVGVGGTAYGERATATGIGTVSVGANSSATANGDVAIGNNANAVGDNTQGASVAIGREAKTWVDQGVSVGASAGDTSGTKGSGGAISIGFRANWGVSNIGTGAIAIGAGASSQTNDSIAIGTTANASSGGRGIAIGKGAVAGAADAYMFGGVNAGTVTNNVTDSFAVAFNETTPTIWLKKAGDSYFNTSGGLAIGSTSLTTDAQLELVSTTKAFLIMRMTAAEAAGITAANGMMLYVTTTDATFTSVGFWGYEAGAWTKL